MGCVGVVDIHAGLSVCVLTGYEDEGHANMTRVWDTRTTKGGHTLFHSLCGCRPGRAAVRDALTRTRRGWRARARRTNERRKEGRACRGGARRQASWPARLRCAGGGSGGRFSRAGRRQSRRAEWRTPSPSPGRSAEGPRRRAYVRRGTGSPPSVRLVDDECGSRSGLSSTTYVSNVSG